MKSHSVDIIADTRKSIGLNIPRRKKKLSSVWHVNAKFSEPNFLDTGCGCQIYHNYGDINLDNALKDTWMKNCMVGELSGAYGFLTYLNFFVRHQGAERLIKCGFANDVEKCYTAAKASRNMLIGSRPRSQKCWV